MKNYLIQMGNLKGKKWERMYEECRRFYDPEGISPTVPTNAGGHHEVKIGELLQVGSLDRPGYDDFSNRVYSPDGVARTLMGGGGNNNDKAGQYMIEEEIEMFENPALEERERDGGMTDDLDNLCVETVIRVRRLTPLECYRLMGFDDGDFQKAKAVVSDGQLYKQAGNSIVVNVLEAIFTNLRPYFRKEDA